MEQAEVGHTGCCWGFGVVESAFFVDWMSRTELLEVQIETGRGFLGIVGLSSHVR